MPRPSSVSMNTPSTPLAQRGGITAPLPVDVSVFCCCQFLNLLLIFYYPQILQHAKRREMEFTKIQTLRLMLDQEKKNLEIINSGNRNNGQDMARAETNIRKLEEELKYVCGEVNTIFFFFFAFY